MHYAHDYQLTFQHADMDTCATYVNYDHIQHADMDTCATYFNIDHHMFDCLHRHLQVDTDVIDMISYESDDVSSDVKPPWTFETYLGSLSPTVTRMSAPCVSAWQPPWALSCWPQAPRASASWLWILFHVVSKSTLCLI